MSEQLICEPIKPVRGAMNTVGLAHGKPGLHKKFIWRDEEYTVDKVLQEWKETSDCRSGSREQYVRKHWFTIRTTNGNEMKIYFERQARSKSQSKLRWWLYALSSVSQH